MSFAWIAVGSAVAGAGASYAGAKKQADASKKGAALQMQQFQTLNRQQQPFIQSGYGAMGKLNTLLGIGARPRPAMPGGAPVGGGQTFSPMPVNGMQRIPQGMPNTQPVMNGSRLSQILRLRAMNGDSEARRIMGLM